MDKDSVYLYWNNKENSQSYKIAELYKYDNKYYFRYILENVKIALKDGFKLLVAFPNINATYESQNLFASGAWWAAAHAKRAAAVPGARRGSEASGEHNEEDRRREWKQGVLIDDAKHYDSW